MYAHYRCLASLVARQHLQTAFVILRLSPAAAHQCSASFSSRSTPHTAGAGRHLQAFATSTRAFAASSSSVATMNPQLAPHAKAVLDYWLGEGWETAPPGDTLPQCRKLWFQGGPEVDAQIVSQFKGDCEALLRGSYDAWQQQPLEALAGILVGDQLFRNAFRGTPGMYAADTKVLAWSKALLASGVEQLAPIQRIWVIMPFMHSEVLTDQDECVVQFAKLAEECEAAGLDEMAKMAKEHEKFAVKHQEVVKQWGRFPHRNAILRRQDTPEEAAGMAAGTIPKW